MAGLGSPTNLDVGGRSPRAGDGRAQDRVSRRLGLTHSLTSPRPAPVVKPDLPSRPTDDDLPRPRSVSPRRTAAPPSVKGSALSARLERASIVRASNAPPTPPPPKTRARFSTKVEALRERLDAERSGNGGSTPTKGANADDNNVDSISNAAPSPTASVSAVKEESLTPTHAGGGGGGGSQRAGGPGRTRAAAAAIAGLTLDTSMPREEEDDTPLVVLPSTVSAAQAAGLAAEKRMRDSRQEQDEGAPTGGEKGRRVRLDESSDKAWGRNGSEGGGRGEGVKSVESRPSSNVTKESSGSVFGVRKSQIKPTEESPLPLPRHREPSVHTPVSNRRSFHDDDGISYDDDEQDNTPDPGFRRGSASYDSPVSPTKTSRTTSPTSAPPAAPPGPAPISPCGTPGGFKASNIRCSTTAGVGAVAGPIAYSGSTDVVPESKKQALPPTPPKRPAVPSLPPPLQALQQHKSPSSLPIAPPETPRDGSDQGPAASLSPGSSIGGNARAAAGPLSALRPGSRSTNHIITSAASAAVESCSPREKTAMAPSPSGKGRDAVAISPGRSSSFSSSPLASLSPAAAAPRLSPRGVDNNNNNNNKSSSRIVDSVVKSPAAAAGFHGSSGAPGASGATNAIPTSLKDGDIPTPPPRKDSTLSTRRSVGPRGKGNNGGPIRNEAAMESDLDFIRELTRYRDGGARASATHDEYEFALVLKPNDEYRDAVEVLELALDMRDGAEPGQRMSPQKLDNARRVRESLDGLPPPNLGASDGSPSGVFASQNGSGRKAVPSQVRPGLSEGLEGGSRAAGRRQRLSLLDDLQEEEGRLTNRRKKELERKKKHRLFHFAQKLKEGIIVRRHLAHHTCEQIVLQSTDDCRTISWKPLLATNKRNESGGGGGVFRKTFRGARSNRSESMKAAHIAFVLPATEADPSHPGFFGTRALRLSEDIPNPARTFSLLYGDWGGVAMGVEQRVQSGANGTLDLECDDDGMYAMLFQGFLLLHMQASHVVGGAMVTPTMTPPKPDLSTPPKAAEEKAAPALDDMEAASASKTRPRPWSMRKSPSSNGAGGTCPADGGNDGSRSSLVRASSAEDRGSGVSPGDGGVGEGTGGSNRGSLRKSLKFLPDLLGGLSSSARNSQKGFQQTASQVAGGAPPEFFLGWTSPGTQIWSRLRMAGLEVEKLYSLDRRHVLLKIRLPRSKLEEVAEVMRLKLRRRDGTMGIFKKHHRSSFSESAGGDLFRSGESQKVIDHLIRSKIKDGGGELDDRTELGKHICKRLPLHNQARLDALYNSWVVYWRAPKEQQAKQHEQQRQLKLRIRRRKKQMSSRVDSNAGGVPSSNALGVKAAATMKGTGVVEDDDEGGDYDTRSERLQERAEEAKEAVIDMARLAVVVMKGSLWQPLELIADYYGEATAFYFAWMGFYTQGLIVPSIFGVIVFGCQVHARTLDHPVMPIYAVFVILWSSALLVLWRQRCSELAYRWGVLHFEQEEQTRSQFWGKEQRDNVTGKFVREYPTWKRWATYAVTMPIMAGFTGGILSLMFMILVKRDGVSDEKRGMSDPEFWGVMLLKPMLYGIAIPILYQLCKKLGVVLNNLENHKTENKYRNALIVKVFSFRFVTVFASLYHYAFISNEGTSNFKLLKLAASLCSFMTIGQWWYMVWMCYIPGKVQNWKIGKLKAKVASERAKLQKAEADEAAGGFGGGGAGATSRSVRRKLLDEAGDHLWEEALLKEYDVADVFDDYTMSLIQFGYVALFSAAFPLAPLLAMINNLVQTRVDAHKICKTRRRPIALKSGGIGVWDNVLELMSVIAVITNCALIGVTSTRWWPNDVSPATRILTVVVAEHIILFLKYWLESSVPRVPHKVQRALQRERVERDHKGVFAESMSGDYAKFEANFSRALVGSTKATSGLGGSGSTYASRTNTNVGNSATKALAVNADLTATTPTPTGRARKGFTVNLSAFASESAAAPIHGGSSAAGVVVSPRSASMSMSGGIGDKVDARGGGDGGDKRGVPLPPPSAASRCLPSETATTPGLSPPPPKRFNWDEDTDQVP